nr:hypothetical protein [Tanacetum cinerariifolium]
RPARHALGIHRGFARGLQPRRRKTRQRTDLSTGERARREERPGLALALEVQQHLRAGAARQNRSTVPADQQCLRTDYGAQG